MSLRHEDLSDAELARQEGLDRSWAAAREALADPQFRAQLDEAIERVNNSRSSETMSKADCSSTSEPSGG